MKTGIISLTLAVISLHPANLFAEHGNAHPNIKDLMNPEQYEAAGIDKLNDEERAALAAWARGFIDENSIGAATTPTAVESPTTSAPKALADAAEEQIANAEPSSNIPDKNWGLANPPEDKSERAKELYANIVGDFSGWNGKSVFRLDNGQVWRQRRSGRFSYRGEARRVVISKNSWGFFEMRLIDADRSVGVRRVK